MPTCDVPTSAFSEIFFHAVNHVLKSAVNGENNGVIVTNDVSVHCAYLLLIYVYIISYKIEEVKLIFSKLEKPYALINTYLKKLVACATNVPKHQNLPHRQA